MITLKDVHKTYQRGARPTVALRGVSLDIAAGQFVSFMGPSGSGKSTLLHLLGALDLPSAGHVIIDGQDLRSLDDDALTLLRRARMGFVFQFFNLLATMTALENAMLPALLVKTSEREARARARDLLVAVGLEARLQHRPEQLSGGEMQRVALARALVNTPRLLLADEPTGNLDQATGEEVLELLRGTTRERDVTVVMVTHDARAAAVGDRVVHLRDGKIVADGRATAAPAAATS
jgi:putative ABC transport system ATP-binding protein